MPPGGFEELMHLGYEDAVRNLQHPIATQGAAELPALLDDLRSQLTGAGGPLALVGASMGSAVALLALAEAGLDVAAAVLISPLSQLRPAVEATGRVYGVTYEWDAETEAIARHLDFVQRAGELRAPGVPVRLLVGEDDDIEGFRQPAEQLRDALAAHVEADVIVVPNMGHSFADEPGTNPAPPSPAAAALDHHAVDWISRHLQAHNPVGSVT